MSSFPATFGAQGEGTASSPSVSRRYPGAPMDAQFCRPFFTPLADLTRQPSVIRRGSEDLKKRHLQVFKPSPGLEPGTASLPWRFRGGTGVHARSFASTFVLQIAVSLCRKCPRVTRVLSLMYPSRTRGALAVLETYNVTDPAMRQARACDRGLSCQRFARVRSGHAEGDHGEALLHRCPASYSSWRRSQCSSSPSSWRPRGVRSSSP
jgi:hypothetical protein